MDSFGLPGIITRFSHWLRRRGIQPIFEQSSDVPLDLFQLIQVQIWISNCKDVTGFRLFVNQDPPAIADDLLLDLQNAFALEHYRQNETSWYVLRIILFDQLPQQRLGGFFLDGFRYRLRRKVNTLPAGNESRATVRIREFGLPAGNTEVGAAEIGVLVNEKRVIKLFVRKRPAARFTALAAGLDVPLCNQSTENITRTGSKLQSHLQCKRL